MGDRVSISFSNRDCKSVALFHHWGGKGFVELAYDYVLKLKKERKGALMPLDRFEPEIVMVDFIRHITKGEKRVESSIYLGATENDGDNSDNGHYDIDLTLNELDLAKKIAFGG